MRNSRSYPWFWSDFGWNSWKHAGAAELDSCWMGLRWRYGSFRSSRWRRRVLLVLSALPLLFQLTRLATLQRTAFWYLRQVWLTDRNGCVTSRHNTWPRCGCLWDWRTVISQRQPWRRVQHRYCIYTWFIVHQNISVWWRWHRCPWCW